MHQLIFTGSAKAICESRPGYLYGHILDVSGWCMSVSIILGFKLDFSSCVNWDGFCESSHIRIASVLCDYCQVVKLRNIYICQ